MFLFPALLCSLLSSLLTFVHPSFSFLPTLLRYFPIPICFLHTIAAFFTLTLQIDHCSIAAPCCGVWWNKVWNASPATWRVITSVNLKCPICAASIKSCSATPWQKSIKKRRRGELQRRQFRLRKLLKSKWRKMKTCPEMVSDGFFILFRRRTV